MRWGQYWMSARPCRRARVRCSGSVKATLATGLRRSNDQMPSTWLRSGALQVGADRQVAVAGPGETLARALEWQVDARAVDQPGCLAGFVAGQCFHGDSAPGAAPGADDGCVATRSPAAGVRRRHREPGLVLEDNPGAERCPDASTAATRPSSTAPPRPRRAPGPDVPGSARTSRGGAAAATPSRQSTRHGRFWRSPCAPVPASTAGPASCALPAPGRPRLQHGELGIRQLRQLRRPGGPQGLHATLAPGAAPGLHRPLTHPQVQGDHRRLVTTGEPLPGAEPDRLTNSLPRRGQAHLPRHTA
jgi:hypothetical protein